jgi:hypothetical protein
LRINPEIAVRIRCALAKNATTPLWFYGFIGSFPQGSRCAATLGWPRESNLSRFLRGFCVQKATNSQPAFVALLDD